MILAGILAWPLYRYGAGIATVIGLAFVVFVGGS